MKLELFRVPITILTACQECKAPQTRNLAIPSAVVETLSVPQCSPTCTLNVTPNCLRECTLNRAPNGLSRVELCRNLRAYTIYVHHDQPALSRDDGEVH